MINVAFLLLIFFLMTAVFEPRGNADIELPTTSVGERLDAGVDIILTEDGEFRPEIDVIVSASSAGQAINLIVDKKASATLLANSLRRIQSLGASEIRLVTILDN